jgi:ELWxxDGT repeat protein
LININGTLFLRAYEGTYGTELWKSDGSSAGTVIVKDINPGSANSGPGRLINVNGTLFFVADDGTNGQELWKSNGTSAGTVLVKDINPGSGNSSPDSLTNVNGTLFFRASDGTNGSELWKSDGSSAGTVIVKDIYPGANGSNPGYLTNVNGTLFFNATDGTNGSELWMDVSNDECQNAFQIYLNQIYYGSNYGDEGNDITSCAYNDFADVWYYFQPQVGGQYTISVSSDEFDTTLALFNACGGDELACNDDYNLQTTDSQVSLDMVKNKTYRIRVAGFDGEMGSFQLDVSAGACAELTLSDLNGDCIVNMQDFAIMASEWLVCNKIPADLCQ